MHRNDSGNEYDYLADEDITKFQFVEMYHKRLNGLF